MNEEQIRRMLKEQLPDSPHEFGTKHTLESWEAAGTPHVWRYLHRDEDAVILVDSGWGYVVIIHNGGIQDVTARAVAVSDKYAVVEGIVYKRV